MALLMWPMLDIEGRLPVTKSSIDFMEKSPRHVERRGRCWKPSGRDGPAARVNTACRNARRPGYCPRQPNDFEAPRPFAGSGIRPIFDKRRVGVDCACLTSTPPIHGATGERSGSDFAATCTGAYRGRRIACDDPRRGSRCDAGEARSGATRSFVHFQVSKFIPRPVALESSGVGEAERPADNRPTLVRLLR
jgi:hypothetical protein